MQGLERFSTCRQPRLRNGTSRTGQMAFVRQITQKNCWWRLPKPSGLHVTHPELSQLHRIVVIGCSGSGKTTLAMRIAAQLDLPHVELDGLFHGPNWVPVAPEVFVSRVAA